MGWKIGHEPTPAEVVDAIASVYALESTSVPHAYKSEIMRFCVHLSSYCASDYFGWDVRGSSPPSSGVPELCIKCGSCTTVTQNGRGGSLDLNKPATCSKCSETLNLLTRQRALCNALVYLYYANRVGVKLGADYKDALKWLPDVRPYKGPHQLDWTEYVDQCYLVTHVVFTLSEWGALRLDKELLPHEYFFLREHMVSQIRVKNVHLVGEFVEALRIFGCDDDDDIVKQGINFLLKEQSKSDGSWDREEGNDAYTVYHATMVGIQGLLPSSCQGFGPSDSAVAELLESWQELEDRKAIDLAINGEIEDRLWAIRRTMKRASKRIQSALVSSENDSSNGKSLLQGGQVDPVTKQNVQASAKRLKLFSQLDKITPMNVRSSSARSGRKFQSHQLTSLSLLHL